jgi:hypothetical protein
VVHRPGQFFVSNPTSQLRDQYFLLADQAAGGCTLGLIPAGAWQPDKPAMQCQIIASHPVDLTSGFTIQKLPESKMMSPQ